jgi:hypothetical protein
MKQREFCHLNVSEPRKVSDHQGDRVVQLTGLAPGRSVLEPLTMTVLAHRIGRPAVQSLSKQTTKSQTSEVPIKVTITRVSKLNRKINKS